MTDENHNMLSRRIEGRLPARLRPVWTWTKREGAKLYEIMQVPPDEPQTVDAAGADSSLAFLDARRVTGYGGRAALIFAGLFVVWAALAPLQSAMLAPGVVVVETHRKTIQHLEGGIVRDIRVSEGETVESGQVLAVLDDAQAGSTLSLLQGEADALTAQEARLVAERDNLPAIVFPADLVARASDPKVAEAMRGEENAFASRAETLDKQVAILNSRIEENQRSRGGLAAEEKALDTQITLINKEAAIFEGLVAKGLEAMPRLLALQRQQADLNGQRGQVAEKKAQVQVNSGETELQIVNLRNERLSEVLQSLRDVQTRKFDLMDRVHAANDVLKRLTLTAPSRGRVVGLAVHTAGAVVRPGDTLMEIVPDRDGLEVEAHVRPEDADGVVVGMPAKVQLSAYKQRRLPVMVGTVTGISADRLTDTRTGQAYFTARVAVDASAWQDHPDAKLIPGVPVEVALQTGSRTFFEYLLAPIESLTRRGLKERELRGVFRQ